MKFNSVFLKWTTVRSEVTGCDAIGRRLWTAGDVLERAASGSSLQTTSFPSFPSFPIKDEVLESDSWGTRRGQLVFFYPNPFSSQPFTQLFLPRICLLCDSGDHFNQPRCSHCIGQGLILVTNLVQVCLWFSWNSWYLGNKQVALTHGMCLLR